MDGEAFISAAEHRTVSASSPANRAARSSSPDRSPLWSWRENASMNPVRSVKGHKDGLWTTVLACAVMLMDWF